ncbi:hypothetical protein VOLCADRAFT_94845 [Volvox carteri f. nagariensis]|uniref:Uncharacterized protein n=1 Tax=Volvox carteri f. nagariensis TaxID=3068 RepID=D8U5X4_VOLCA|nr:uncharacterized protein VOLCADRAFT_94845 [Volvox carteri f. nagariensis]EFJ44761.1 hypothetical protein VOLCADRAFT_94845 [Volvox carteri f. nagariensis]|eukprot:XP_002954044.1 hypothetical protein VOLCADRAFT_94845 [Volvox carteri f. nagariensis]
MLGAAVYRRTAPKARDQFNEEAATGRRRQNVHHESSRQRDANLRARRLQAELSGIGHGELSEAGLASLGPDVLSERVTKLAAALQSWHDATPADLLMLLQQLATLLSTGVYQAVQAAVASQVVPLLIAILQQVDSQLPPGAARTAAYSLELIASDSLTSAQAVRPAVPALTNRLGAAMAVLGATACSPSGGGGEAAAAAAAVAAVGPADREAVLAEAAQLAAPLGALAGWGQTFQEHLTESGAAGLLLQLLIATMDCAAERVSPAVDAAAQVVAGEAPPPPLMAPDQLAALQHGPDPLEVQCCSTALWAVGMMVRDRGDAVAQLVTHQELVGGLRRVLLAPTPYPELLRGVAWVVAFCSSCGGPAARQALVDSGGLLPGLVLSTMRFARYAAALAGEEPTLRSATQPLHRALLPLLLAAANVAADPDQTLLVLSELQASRPLLLSGAGGGPGLTSTGMEVLMGCLQGRVSHRRIQAGAVGLAAALAGGAHSAGPVAVDAVRAALSAAGAVPVLVELLRSSTMDVRREAAAALALLTEGAPAALGSEPRPGRLAMLRTLGVTGKADEQGVLKAFLDLLRGFTPDAVHAALRFVTVALRELKGARRLVEELDGIDALEVAQEGRSGLNAPALQLWAQELVDEYFGIDCEEQLDEGEEEDSEQMEDGDVELQDAVIV